MSPQSPSTQPLDDESSDVLSCPPLRWGLLGCGRVSHDFAQSLKLVPTATIVCCAARNIESSKSFADKHNIDKYYGNYDDLINDPDVDVIYVANIHKYRRSIGEKCILANKHTVLEKPFALNYADAEYLVSLAKERNVFVMEGMWTRFFPVMNQIRKLLSDKSIGEVVSVYSDFNYNGSKYGDDYPTSFCFDWALGGGATLLLGPYPIAAALDFFDGRFPETIKAVGNVDKRTKAELLAALTLSFSSTSDIAPVDNSSNENTPKLPGSGMAVLTIGFLADTPEITTIIGTKGRITILTPSHCPTKLTLTLDDSPNPIHYDFPLPPDTPEIIEAGKYHYPNSAGFAYEAAAVARCIASGKTEAPQMTLNDTLNCMKIMDELRLQLGVPLVTESS